METYFLSMLLADALLFFLYLIFLNHHVGKALKLWDMHDRNLPIVKLYEGFYGFLKSHAGSYMSFGNLLV